MRAVLVRLVFAAVLLGWTIPAPANLVLNGGFETGDFTAWTYRSLSNLSFVDVGFAHDGTRAAFLGDSRADGGGSLSQSLATVAGVSYTLSFWFAGDGDSPSGFRAAVGGVEVVNLVDPPFSRSYIQFTANFVAAGNATLLEFNFYDDPFFLNLDDISVNPSASVPEPASVALLGSGVLLGLGIVRRRRAGGNHA